MMNKRGWTGRDYVIALILFSAVIALAYVAVGSLATDYDSPGIVDSSFSEHYDQLDSNTQVAEDMLSSTSSSSGLSILGTAEVLLSSTFAVISLIFGSLTTLGSQVANIGTDFGVPTIVSSIILTTLLSIITVGIIFIIINAVNKTDKL